MLEASFLFCQLGRCQLSCLKIFPRIPKTDSGNLKRQASPVLVLGFCGLFFFFFFFLTSSKFLKFFIFLFESCVGKISSSNLAAAFSSQSQVSPKRRRRQRRQGTGHQLATGSMPCGKRSLPSGPQQTQPPKLSHQRGTPPVGRLPAFPSCSGWRRPGGPLVDGNSAAALQALCVKCIAPQASPAGASNHRALHLPRSFWSSLACIVRRT